METKLPLILVVGTLSLAPPLKAQERYLDEVFTNVKVTSNVIYSVNASVLTFNLLGNAVPIALECDIYQPESDSETSRPLIIMLHSGGFLPPLVNGGCRGSKTDASTVEMARRLARRGFVVASANYRLGWNPITPSQPEFIFTLINAAYRGVQDAKTCVRFFRKTVAEDSNPYGVDPDRIGVWGFGTGGYVALAAATLFDVQQTHIPKFFIGANPMVSEIINGDVEGKKVGIVPPGINYPFPAGDTLCYTNHVDYSSDFHLMVNLSGALLDSSWLHEGDMPMISFHVPGENNTPCDHGFYINLPPPFQPFMEVSGSCYVQSRIAYWGNNAVFASANFIDPISQAADAINDGRDGFYPFFTNDITIHSPWDYALSSNPYNLTSDPGCDTNAVKGFFYHDTILQYFAPRACLALDLGCDLSAYTSSTRDLSPAQTGLNLFPNPVAEVIRLRSNPEYPMQEVQIFDLRGRMIRTLNGINQENAMIPNHGMAPGLSFARVFFRQGVSTVKFAAN
jgi:acetyl esterase/lipase